MVIHIFQIFLRFHATERKLGWNFTEKVRNQTRRSLSLVLRKDPYYPSPLESNPSIGFMFFSGTQTTKSLPKNFLTLWTAFGVGASFHFEMQMPAGVLTSNKHRVRLAF